MTVKDLRTLVDNLDEYIHVPGGIERLKKTILHLAVSGQLVPQDPSEGTGEELYNQIQTEKSRSIQRGKAKQQKSLTEISAYEMPYGIPLSWKWTRLGKISESNIGLTYRPSDLGDKGIPVLRSNNIRDGVINYDDLVRVSVDVSETKMVKPGDLLVCARNGSRRLVGKVAIIKEQGMSFGAFMALVRSPHNDFIKIFLESPKFREKLDGVQTTTINQITQANLNSFAVPLPPKKEQERIVSRVREFNTLIEGLEERYKSEQAERKRLVISSLLHLSRGDSNIAFTLLTEIIRTKSDAAELRKTILNAIIWRSTYNKVKLVDTCKIYQPKTISTKELNPQGRYDVYGANGVIGKYDKYNHEEPEVLMTCRGATCGEMNMSNPFSWINGNAMVCHPNGIYDLSKEYLLLALKSADKSTVVTGSAQPQITQQKLKWLTFPLPPIVEQTRIVQKATQLLDLVTKLEKHLER